MWGGGGAGGIQLILDANLGKVTCLTKKTIAQWHVAISMYVILFGGALTWTCGLAEKALMERLFRFLLLVLFIHYQEARHRFSSWLFLAENLADNTGLSQCDVVNGVSQDLARRGGNHKLHAPTSNCNRSARTAAFGRHTADW